MTTPTPVREIDELLSHLAAIVNSGFASSDDELARLHWQARKLLRSDPADAHMAAYHWALTVSHFCPNPTPAQAEGMHKALIRRFQSVPKQGFRGAGIAREIGAWLDKGRKPRTIVDYELNATIQKNGPVQALSYAEHVRKQVAQFAALHNPPHTA